MTHGRISKLFHVNLASSNFSDLTAYHPLLSIRVLGYSRWQCVGRGYKDPRVNVMAFLPVGCQTLVSLKLLRPALGMKRVSNAAVHSLESKLRLMADELIRQQPSLGRTIKP